MCIKRGFAVEKGWKTLVDAPCSCVDVRRWRTSCALCVPVDSGGAGYSLYIIYVYFTLEVFSFKWRYLNGFVLCWKIILDSYFCVDGCVLSCIVFVVGWFELQIWKKWNNCVLLLFMYFFISTFIVCYMLQSIAW